MKAPKITVDAAALKKGFWGNTWKNWGYIFAAFMALYLFEAGYFTGLLYAAEDIRGTDYRSLGKQYFGKFERDTIPIPFPLGGVSNPEPFNRPEGCVDGETTENVTVDDITIPVTRPNAVQTCTSNKKNTAWVVFPWVKAANPACESGNTVLTPGSSPAYVPPEGVAVPSDALPCQNFVPATAPAPAPALPVVEAPAAADAEGN